MTTITLVFSPRPVTTFARLGMQFVDSGEDKRVDEGRTAGRLSGTAP